MIEEEVKKNSSAPQVAEKDGPSAAYPQLPPLP